MDPKELFAKSISQATGCLNYLEPRQLTNPTPWKNWNVEQLLALMVYELRCVPEILSGKKIEQINRWYRDDFLGTDIKSAWQHAADAALVAVKRVNSQKMVFMPYGKVSAKHYIADIAGDILIHTWDLDQGMNCTLRIEPDLARIVYKNALPHRREKLTKLGLFGTPIHTSRDASIQTKLLALFGRQIPGTH